MDGKRTIPLTELDRLFDEGSDEIDDFIDWSKPAGHNQVPAPVQFELPAVSVDALDRIAAGEGITRGALVQRWVTEKLATVVTSP